MLKSVLILLFAMCSIQFGASQAKILFPLLGAAGASSLRLVFAALMLSIIFRPWKIKFTPSLLVYGASLGFMNLSFYFALERIPLGVAVALEFTGPLAVAIFSSKRKIDYLWAILAGAGIVLLLPVGVGSLNLDPLGTFLALLAGFFWAMYILYGKHAGNDLRGGVATTVGMIIAALLVIPFGVFMDGDKLLNHSAYLPMLIVAFFGSALPYSLEMIALQKIPTQTFGVFMSIEPALASLMGLIFLAESLSVTQWLAISCIIISSLGSSLSPKK